MEKYLAMTFSYDEIADGNAFEDLVTSYFEALQNDQISETIRIKANKSGIGPDGGRDILVDIDQFDRLVQYKRRWVVQCKFHKKNISPKEISTINIPTLIHSNNANGYLLICKEHVTSGTALLFDKLNSECKFGYKYEIWDGQKLKDKLIEIPSIMKMYFPNCYDKSFNLQAV
jgi:hypothetical protein